MIRSFEIILASQHCKLDHAYKPTIKKSMLIQTSKFKLIKVHPCLIIHLFHDDYRGKHELIKLGK